MVRTQGDMGGEHGGVVAGVVRALPDNNLRGRQRASDGLQERRRVGCLDEREGGVLSKQRAGERGGGMTIAGKGSCDGADTGGIRVAVRADRKREEACGDGGLTDCDS